MNLPENKFLIILGSVTAVLAIILVVFGFKGSGRYAMAEDEFQSAQNELHNMTRQPIKPTDGNLKAKQAALREYVEDVTQLQAAFDGYRRPDPVAIDPAAFVDALLEAKNRLAEQFSDQKVKVPEQFALGMGRYTIEQPSRRETGQLKFALGAFEELFSHLASAGPVEVINIAWAGLPKEKTENANQNRRNSRRNKSKAEEKHAYHSHVLEITLRGSEESLRQFLGSLDDSPNHYYQVRVMRVKNSRSSAPNAKDATFKTERADAAGQGGGLNGGLSFEDFFPDGANPAEDEPDEGAEPAVEDEAGEGDEAEGPIGIAEVAPPVEETPPSPPKVTDSGEILKQVLGSEDINVYLKIDVIQFLEPKEIPEIK